MTITQSRLLELQNLYNRARPDGTTPAFLWTECKEVINELVASRDAISLLREERVKLQDENEQLRSERRMQQVVDADIMGASAAKPFVPPSAADEREHGQELRLKALEDRTGQLTDYVNTLSDKLDDQLGVVSRRVSDLVRLIDANLSASAPGKLVDAIDRDVTRVSKDFDLFSERIDARIDKVVEIIGERIDGLVGVLDDLDAHKRNAIQRLDNIEDLLGEKSRGPGALYYATRIAQLADAVRELNPGWRGWSKPDTSEVAFPTGGASTAEAAAEAVPTLPQRGDRVRLEGAESTIGVRIKDGWYDVVGGHYQSFQIRHPSTPGAVLRALSWVHHDDPGLKAIRPGAAEDVEK